MKVGQSCNNCRHLTHRTINFEGKRIVQARVCGFPIHELPIPQMIRTELLPIQQVDLAGGLCRSWEERPKAASP